MQPEGSVIWKPAGRNIVLESYEDSLDNLQTQRSGVQQGLLDSLAEEAPG